MRSLVFAALTLAAFASHAQTSDSNNATQAIATPAPATAPAQSPTEPASNGSTPAVATPGMAPATTTPATPAATDGSAPKDGSAKVAAPVVPVSSEGFTAPRGYRKEKRDYGDVYCRNESDSSSRFTKKRCYTQQDLEYVLAAQKEASEELARASRVCSSAAACARN